MLRWVLLLSLAQLGWAFYDPNCNGKQVIVHLFEWKWTDIANECERFLAGAGYCGVQVYQPTLNPFSILFLHSFNYMIMTDVKNSIGEPSDGTCHLTIGQLSLVGTVPTYQLQTLLTFW